MVREVGWRRGTPSTFFLGVGDDNVGVSSKAESIVGWMRIGEDGMRVRKGWVGVGREGAKGKRTFKVEKR